MPGFGAISAFRAHALHAKHFAIMDKRAGPEDLPDDVIKGILRSDHLPLLDKLRYQGVCKSWNNLIRNGSQPDNLVNELRVHLASVTLRPSLQRSALQRDEQVPLVVIHPTALAAPCQSYHACCQWLTLRANLFDRIHLSARESHTWQLQEVLEIVQAACLKTSAVLAVRLWAGES